MVKAMEVSGIEGNFRFACESVMQVLRGNKDSVMAMLEAFVHDPLINWRLLNTTDTAADAHLVREAEQIDEAELGEQSLQGALLLSYRFQLFPQIAAHLLPGRHDALTTKAWGTGAGAACCIRPDGRCQ